MKGVWVISQYIERLAQWLAANISTYYAKLQIGVTKNQLKQFEDQFQIAMPDTFHQLYSWRNGQLPNSNDALQGNRQLLSLEEISSVKDMMDGMIGLDFDNPCYWRRTWIPLLSNGGGSYLCIDMSTEDDGTPGRLIGFWKADEDRPIEYPSLDAWLVEIVQTMETGLLELI
jgi:cell wall assembly regulator SMI1